MRDLGFTDLRLRDLGFIDLGFGDLGFRDLELKDLGLGFFKQQGAARGHKLVFGLPMN